ncbi:TDT family transporter [Sporomusa acidovorans]|uniref:Potassium-tellurite ethidium and proflavin transporter n=1 Tax=Sporomusa acidovorans (strain ATCC 49682 / DSM 3132 / Mol) TaxID=1123286 RepID=A0ABZ3J0E8_SPOA4|nr:TDT family transporter [Sporomusa acidovorans]OZC22853.1 potassium-tellurite ethidium and proflavin transporter [Sporomusa acidovorans DSM 3132]SDE53021.1 exfoliative toxin A/B [Sporomusa acidovorans]
MQQLLPEVSPKQGIVQLFKKSIRATPIPISGLLLGIISTGNMLSTYGNIFRILSGLIFLFLALMLISKTFIYADAIIKDLKSPVITGISSTFPMAVVVLSTYIYPFWSLAACVVCGLGILIHFILIIYYTIKYLFNFNIQQALPSYFVVYVGIAIFSVVSPVFNAMWIGQIFFWFGFITYLFLLPVISYRVFVINSIPDPIQPTIAIFAAPASLCLTGYLNSFQEKNMIVVWLLALLSLTMLFVVLWHMPKMIKNKFFPSYSAFTFPLVISAISIKTLNTFLTTTGMESIILKYLAYFEEFLALFFVVYVLVKYIDFLFYDNC